MSADATCQESLLLLSSATVSYIASEVAPLVAQKQVFINNWLWLYGWIDPTEVVVPGTWFILCGNSLRHDPEPSAYPRQQCRHMFTANTASFCRKMYAVILSQDCIWRYIFAIGRSSVNNLSFAFHSPVLNRKHNAVLQRWMGGTATWKKVASNHRRCWNCWAHDRNW